MSVTDTIADGLTKIRNALMIHSEKVSVRASGLMSAVLGILKENGYIENFKRIDDKRQGTFHVYLKYGDDKKSVITGLKRISTPGKRTYVDRRSIPRVLRGRGMAIISTSKGVMTDTQARESGVGGELICYVW
jgi:small subunit ribosomal protein S8